MGNYKLTISKAGIARHVPVLIRKFSLTASPENKLNLISQDREERDGYEGLCGNGSKRCGSR